MMTIQSDNADFCKILSEASRVLAAGGIACFPTETFYGLGVKYDHRPAHEKLFGLKQRPQDKPLPLIIGAIDMLDCLVARVSAVEELLMRSFWPGPLTLLLPARQDLPDFITSGRPGRVAVRIPGASVALELAKSLDYPITATSANISGMPAADNPGDVARYFGERVDLVIDGGKTPGGRSSTIVEVLGEHVRVIRQGVISEDELAKVLRAAGYDR
ncbi:MAG: threonylcarbamoyl-AMP synthase [Thermodesulfovibrio sp.]|nr:threonylcarbamoyl-AMP synthase [Thermodesulfovibrio sp.]